MHDETKLFSLIGRHVILNEDWDNFPGKPLSRHGIIREKKPGRMRFAIEFPDTINSYWFDRSEFKLIPLDKRDRRVHRLPDYSDGVVYSGVEGF